MGPRLGLDRLFISDRLFSVDSVSATQELLVVDRYRTPFGNGKGSARQRSTL